MITSIRTKRLLLTLFIAVATWLLAELPSKLELSLRSTAVPTPTPDEVVFFNGSYYTCVGGNIDYYSFYINQPLELPPYPKYTTMLDPAPGGRYATLITCKYGKLQKTP
jgi:hypothetical protein